MAKPTTMINKTVICDTCGISFTKAIHNQKRHTDCAVVHYRRDKKKRYETYAGHKSNIGKEGQTICLKCSGAFLAREKYNKICSRCATINSRKGARYANAQI